MSTSKVLIGNGPLAMLTDASHIQMTLESQVGCIKTCRDHFRKQWKQEIHVFLKGLQLEVFTDSGGLVFAHYSSFR